MRTMENENREYILRVYGALQEKGYNAVGQIVGWWHIGQDHLNLKLKTRLGVTWAIQSPGKEFHFMDE